MEFVRTTQGALMQYVGVQHSYVGGTNNPLESALSGYIRGKKLDQHKVVDLFNYCLFATTENAMMAEDRLLECSGSCWNLHRRSGLQPDPGLVYILLSCG